MRTSMKSTAAIAALIIMGACAQQEEPIMIQDTPIYGKDGTIIGSRPAVAPGGSSDYSSNSTSSGGIGGAISDDDDDDDG